MTRSYSLDLRERVARFVEGGESCHAAAARFGVSVSFAVKLMAAFRRSGSLKASDVAQLDRKDHPAQTPLERLICFICS